MREATKRLYHPALLTNQNHSTHSFFSFILETVVRQSSQCIVEYLSGNDTQDMIKDFWARLRERHLTNNNRGRIKILLNSSTFTISRRCWTNISVKNCRMPYENYVTRWVVYPFSNPCTIGRKGRDQDISQNVIQNDWYSLVLVAYNCNNIFIELNSIIFASYELQLFLHAKTI